ncbi:MAG: hypothetical protein CL933_17590 [Deltaproteobacteria bacterium]|nr:hypothetical protein [Deltaproteobacteria bacterium]
MAKRTLRETHGPREDGDHPARRRADLPMRATLRQMNIPRSTFYGWYQRYIEDGFDGLHDIQSAHPRRSGPRLGSGRRRAGGPAPRSRRNAKNLQPTPALDESSRANTRNSSGKLAPFEDLGGGKGQYTAVAEPPSAPNKNAPDLSGRGHWEKMERETGFEPATLSLGS